MAEFLDFMVALRVEIMGARTLRQERTPVFHMAGNSHKVRAIIGSRLLRTNV